MLRTLRTFCTIAVLAASAAAPATAADFDAWLAELRAEAATRGIGEATLAANLDGLEPVAEVITSDRSQPTRPSDFCEYMEKRLTPTRIARGQRHLAEHAELLDALAARYGVPARYLVALWGLETNFGDYQGDHPVIPALVTLAFDPRRGSMFRQQVFAALRIAEEGHPPDSVLRGSWAGAMGQVQFMPTTFLEYAVDHDGDGRKDIWTNVPDALASAAHYLSRSGWRAGENWGRQVTLPKSLEKDPNALADKREVAEWQSLGVRSLGGHDLPTAELSGAIVLPRRKGTPAFLVYPNYRAFLAWNRSTYFAVSVGTLADELTDTGGIDLCGIRREAAAQAAAGPTQGPAAL